MTQNRRAFAPFFATLLGALVVAGIGLALLPVLDLGMHAVWRPMNCHGPFFTLLAVFTSLLVMRGHKRTARVLASVPLLVAGLNIALFGKGIEMALEGIIDAEQRAELQHHMLKEAALSASMSTVIAVVLLGTTWWVTRSAASNTQEKVTP